MTQLIKSMTGYGRSESSNGNKKISVEIKSVNHRYCDINLKLPRKLNCFENNIRNIIKEKVQRGKIDIFIFYEDLEKGNITVKYNKALALEYFNCIKEMEKDFDLPSDIKATILSRFNDVLTIEETNLDDDSIFLDIKFVLDQALTNFNNNREIEGEKLAKDLILKLDNMKKMVDIIESKSPEFIAAYKKRLMEKIRELTDNIAIDEQRFAMEVAIFSDKVCIDEEIVRLKSHVEAARNIISEGGNVGRKMDFLSQEMNREANTILSKANSVDISDLGIELKTEIEKFREQIQNIE